MNQISTNQCTNWLLHPISEHFLLSHSFCCDENVFVMVFFIDTFYSRNVLDFFLHMVLKRANFKIFLFVSVANVCHCFMCWRLQVACKI